MPRRVAPNGTLLVLGVFCVVGAAVLIGCAPAEGGGGSLAMTQAAGPGGPPPVGFHATVFRLRLPAERIGQLDAQALTAKAATVEGLQGALAQLGQAEVLYHAYQVIGLTSESKIIIGARKPFVVGTRMTDAGGKINTVQYQQVGAIFTCSPEPAKDPGGKPSQMRLEVELSDMGESDVEVTSGMKGMTILSVQMKHTGEPRLGRPVVLIDVDAASGRKDSQPVAYICRILLDRPH